MMKKAKDADAMNLENEQQTRLNLTLWKENFVT